MFFENEFARPLFDSVNGGPPRAFECKSCGRVCRTERGIKQHMKLVHNHTEQPCLSLTDNRNLAEQQRKQLRVSPPPSRRNPLSIPATEPDQGVQPKPQPPTGQKRKGTKSPKPMNEEKSNSSQMIIDGLNSATATTTEQTKQDSSTRGTETK